LNRSELKETASKATGLPDGLFANQNSNLGRFWRALQWEETVGIINGHLEYGTAIWYTVWYISFSFSTYFHPFWYVAPRKIWQSFASAETEAKLKLASFSIEPRKIVDALSPNNGGRKM
jgi:hypothetical protein